MPMQIEQLAAASGGQLAVCPASSVARSATGQPAEGPGIVDAQSGRDAGRSILGHCEDLTSPAKGRRLPPAHPARIVSFLLTAHLGPEG
eukprot:scaffold12300_cov132-Isochrysis_galbana.AAC.8